MRNNAFQYLKQLIVESKKLPFHSTDASQWTLGQFQLLSQLFHQELDNSPLLTPHEREHLGTTISASNLRRYLKYDFVLRERVDKRQLKSLDKLCVFVDFKDWASFYQYFIENHSEDEAKIKDIIQKAIQAEFDAYRSLPTIHTDELKKYFLVKGSAYKRIEAVLQRRFADECILNNPNNSSTSELVEFRLSKIEEAEIHVQTKEYWYLRWYNKDSLELEYIYNELNEQFYILIKTDDTWKIKMNYYESPNTEKEEAATS